MKKCKKCGVEKPIENFRFAGKWRQALCYSCEKIYNRDRAKRMRSNGYYVYYLPEEHYVGITSSLDLRMSQHRNKGKITNDYEVICVFERRVDASWFEVMLHQRGYNGYNNQQ